MNLAQDVFDLLDLQLRELIVPSVLRLQLIGDATKAIFAAFLRRLNSILDLLAGNVDRSYFTRALLGALRRRIFA